MKTTILNGAMPGDGFTDSVAQILAEQQAARGGQVTAAAPSIAIEKAVTPAASQALARAVSAAPCGSHTSRDIADQICGGQPGAKDSTAASTVG